MKSFSKKIVVLILAALMTITGLVPVFAAETYTPAKVNVGKYQGNAPTHAKEIYVTKIVKENGTFLCDLESTSGSWAEVAVGKKTDLAGKDVVAKSETVDGHSIFKGVKCPVGESFELYYSTTGMGEKRAISTPYLVTIPESMVGDKTDGEWFTGQCILMTHQKRLVKMDWSFDKDGKIKDYRIGKDNKPFTDSGNWVYETVKPILESCKGKSIENIDQIEAVTGATRSRNAIMESARDAHGKFTGAGAPEAPDDVADLEKEMLEIAANDATMFYVIESFLTNIEGQEFLYITLSGAGYHDLYKGEYAAAVATGMDSSKWIHGTERKDKKQITFIKHGKPVPQSTQGTWRFAIPVTEKDTVIPICGLPDKYVSKKTPKWFAKQITLDRNNKTIKVNDRIQTTEIKPLDKKDGVNTLFNNASDLDIKKVDVITKGAPTHTKYYVTADVTFGSEKYDKVWSKYFSVPVKGDKAEFNVAEVISYPKDKEKDVNLVGKKFALWLRRADNGKWKKYNVRFDLKQDSELKTVATLTVDRTEADKKAAAKRIPYKITAVEDLSMQIMDAYTVFENGRNVLYITLGNTSFERMCRGNYWQALQAKESSYIDAKLRKDSVDYTYPKKDKSETRNSYDHPQFRIPLSKSEGTFVISTYSKGSKRWYPRKITVDQKKHTVSADAYEDVFVLKIIDEEKWDKVSSAKLLTNGGPHSSGMYKDVTLVMKDNDYDKLYIGKAADAAKADKVVELKDGKFDFRIMQRVKIKKGVYENKGIEGVSAPISFHNAKTDKWEEIPMHFSEKGKALVIGDDSNFVPEVEPVKPLEPGVEYKAGWKWENGAWRLYKSDATMVKQKMCVYKGVWYMFDKDGKMISNVMRKYKGHWYMLDKNGKMISNVMRKYKGHWYILDKDGKMISNVMRKYKGHWYILDKNGKMISNVMRKYKGHWYMLDKNGNMLKNQSKVYKGRVYKINSQGYCI